MNLCVLVRFQLWNVVCWQWAKSMCWLPPWMVSVTTISRVFSLMLLNVNLLLKIWALIRYKLINLREILRVSQRSQRNFKRVSKESLKNRLLVVNRIKSFHSLRDLFEIFRTVIFLMKFLAVRWNSWNRYLSSLINQFEIAVKNELNQLCTKGKKNRSKSGWKWLKSQIITYILIGAC